VFNGVKPVSYVDAVALTHDINYLLGKEYMKEADDIAIGKSDYTPPGLIMNIGLRTRKLFNLNFAGKSDIQTYQSLKNFVLFSPLYEDSRLKYGLDETWFVK